MFTGKGSLFIAIMTFITICAWVVFEIIHARSQVEIPAKIQELIQPINPEFDTKIVESLP